jgi:hypothetical protein
MRIIFLGLAFLIASLLGAGLTFGDRQSFAEMFSIFTRELSHQTSQAAKTIHPKLKAEQSKPLERLNDKPAANDLSTFYIPTDSEVKDFYINKYHKEAITEISKALDAIEQKHKVDIDVDKFLQIQDFSYDVKGGSYSKGISGCKTAIADNIPCTEFYGQCAGDNPTLWDKCNGAVNDPSVGYYEGGFDNGRFNGQGILRNTALGIQYEGNFYEGQFRGYGELTILQKYKLIGCFSDDLANFNGIIEELKETHRKLIGRLRLVEDNFNYKKKYEYFPEEINSMMHSRCIKNITQGRKYVKEFFKATEINQRNSQWYIPGYSQDPEIRNGSLKNICSTIDLRNYVKDFATVLNNSERYGLKGFSRMWGMTFYEHAYKKHGRSIANISGYEIEPIKKIDGLDVDVLLIIDYQDDYKQFSKLPVRITRGRSYCEAIENHRLNIEKKKLNQEKIEIEKYSDQFR